MSIDAGAVSLALKLNSTAFEKSISSVAKKAAGLLASALAVNGLLDFTQQCVELGSTLMATESTFSTVFGSLESQAEEALTAIAEQAGSTVESMRASFTQIAAFAKTTGVDTADALDLTTRATTAAADIAAFYDKSIDTVTDSLQSFLKGNYENDAALGLSCTETTRNAAANELYGKSFQDLSEAQKQLTLLQMVEDANAASGALGQAARESSSWAVQSQYLAQQTQAFMANIGAGLINLLTPALNAINVVMERIVQLSSSFRSLTETLFGTSSTGGASGVASNLADASDSSASLADSLTDGTSALSGLDSVTSGAADSLGQASETAAALKRSLEGFDQITRVEEDTSSSGSSGGDSDSGDSISTVGVDTSGLDSLTDAAETATESLSPLTGAWKKFADFVNGLNFTPLQTAWNNLKQSGERLGTVISGALQWGLENVLAPLAEWTVEEAAPAGLNLLSAGLDVLSSVCEALEEPAQWIWDNFLEPVAAWTGDLVIQALNLLTDALEGLSDWIDEHQALIEAIVPPVVAFFAAIVAGQSIVGVITAISGAFTGIVSTVTTVVTAFQAASSVGAMLQGMLMSVGGATAPLIVAIAAVVAAGVLLYQNWDTVKVYLDAAWEAIKATFSAAVTAVTGFCTSLWENIKSIWDGICNVIQVGVMLIGSILEAAWNIITLPFQLIWQNCGDTITSVWNAITETVSDKISAVSSVLSTVVTAISSFMSSAWNGIKSTVTTIFNAIKSVASSVWTAISSTISSVVGGIRDKVSSIFNAVSKTVSSVFNEIKSTATSVWNGIKSAITTPIEAAKSTVKSILDKISGLFSSLKLELPSIKLPHFSISGEFSISPPSVPHLSIEWYKKAMNTPMLLDSPTLFGAGEAGPEVVAGAQKLESMIRSAVQNSTVASSLSTSAQEYQRLGTPALAATSRSSDQAYTSARASEKEKTEPAVDLERLEELLEAILTLLKGLDPVALDPESLRKYFIRVTNRNTQANGGRCELRV